MKDYIRKRVLDICNHILESKHTVRQAAVVFGVSKSTVHTVIPKVNGPLCPYHSLDALFAPEHCRYRYLFCISEVK